MSNKSHLKSFRREREDQLRDLAKDLEAAKRDNYELKEDNKEFNVDIDKYLLMINELTMINKEVTEIRIKIQLKSPLFIVERRNREVQ